MGSALLFSDSMLGPHSAHALERRVCEMGRIVSNKGIHLKVNQFGMMLFPKTSYEENFFASTKVLSKSCMVCAQEIKPASNIDGAK